MRGIQTQLKRRERGGSGKRRPRADHRASRDRDREYSLPGERSSHGDEGSRRAGSRGGLHAWHSHPWLPHLAHGGGALSQWSYPYGFPPGSYPYPAAPPPGFSHHNAHHYAEPPHPPPLQGTAVGYPNPYPEWYGAGEYAVRGSEVGE